MLTAIGLTGVLSTRFSGHLDGCLPPLAPLLRQISSPPGGWRARRAPAVDDGRYHRVLYGLFGDDAKEGGGAGLSHAAGVRLASLPPGPLISGAEEVETTGDIFMHQSGREGIRRCA
jgi:hypothetical protein